MAQLWAPRTKQLSSLGSLGQMEGFGIPRRRSARMAIEIVLHILCRRSIQQCSRARFTREPIEVSVALLIVFSLDRHLLSGLVVQINLFVAFFL